MAETPLGDPSKHSRLYSGKKLRSQFLEDLLFAVFHLALLAVKMFLSCPNVYHSNQIGIFSAPSTPNFVKIRTIIPI